MDLLTSEIEESLQPESATIQSNLSSFIFQVLRRKIKIEGLKEDQKDAYFLVAIEKFLGKVTELIFAIVYLLLFIKPFVIIQKRT